jgi:transposase
MAHSILWVGMDVHKDFVMLAVFRGRATRPLYLEKVSFDPNRLRPFFQRLADGGEIRACYEASGAGYVLQRWMAAWGYRCEVIAPSLIPTRPGEQRKHDKRDALQLARL